jgi:uncharacterized membrane protein
MNLALPLLSLAAFATAMMAGLFYAFQWLVMPGLNATESLMAVKSMQAINLAVRNVFFMFAFFGPLVLGAVAALLYLGSSHSTPALCTWASFLAYAVGAFGITMMFNIPLNNSLAAASPTAATAGEIWRTFYDPWMFWNLVRTIVSIVSLLLFAAALWFEASIRQSAERRMHVAAFAHPNVSNIRWGPRTENEAA